MASHRLPSWTALCRFRRPGFGRRRRRIQDKRLNPSNMAFSNLFWTAVGCKVPESACTEMGATATPPTVWRRKDRRERAFLNFRHLLQGDIGGRSRPLIRGKFQAPCPTKAAAKSQQAGRRASAYARNLLARESPVKINFTATVPAYSDNFTLPSKGGTLGLEDATRKIALSVEPPGYSLGGLVCQSG